jgi:hypothetical protein
VLRSTPLGGIILPLSLAPIAPHPEHHYPKNENRVPKSAIFIKSDRVFDACGSKQKFHHSSPRHIEESIEHLSIILYNKNRRACIKFLLENRQAEFEGFPPDIPPTPHLGEKTKRHTDFPHVLESKS